MIGHRISITTTDAPRTITLKIVIFVPNTNFMAIGTMLLLVYSIQAVNTV